MHSVEMGADNIAGSSQRPFLPAVVGPRAARVIGLVSGADLHRYAQGLLASPIQENREYGEELRLGLRSLSEAARQWEERTGRGSDRGTAELAPAELAPDLGDPPGNRLVVGQVAERLKLKARSVTKACQRGSLSAIQPGGPGTAWLIDAESVADYEARRRI